MTTQDTIPTDIHTSTGFVGTSFGESNAEQVACNIVKLQKSLPSGGVKGKSWQAFTKSQYRTFCEKGRHDAVTPEEFSVIDGLKEFGFLKRQGNRLIVTDKFIQALHSGNYVKDTASTVARADATIPNYVVNAYQLLTILQNSHPLTLDSILTDIDMGDEAFEKFMEDLREASGEDTDDNKGAN